MLDDFFVDEVVLDDDGIYGSLCEEDVSLVADAIEEIEDTEFDVTTCEDDDDDIILSMLGVDINIDIDSFEDEE